VQLDTRRGPLPTPGSRSAGGCGEDHPIPVSDDGEHSEGAGSLTNVGSGVLAVTKVGFVTALPPMTFSSNQPPPPWLGVEYSSADSWNPLQGFEEER